MKTKLFKWVLWIAVSVVVLTGVSLLSLLKGTTGISIRDALSVLAGSSGSIERSIILDIRLPRILVGFAVGGALSVSGVIMQGMFRNPLVEPYTLGISGGAALGVCLNIVFGLNQSFGAFSMPASGFAGAILIVIVVYALSIRRGMLQIQGLLLTGVMLSFISSSLIMLLMAVSRAEDLQGIIFWIMGSLEESNRTLINASVIVSLSGLFASYFYSLDLNALSLGEDEAHHLGINVDATKKALFVIASMLTGFSVSVSGVIGFVGLVVPHVMRLVAGSDHRILLITSYIWGAAFLILCDTIARTVISPMELPVGVISGLLGGSVFIYALSKRMPALGK